jgi:hypothetical protein
MVPETLPDDADPISQIRFPRTSSHLHQHAKLHVLRLHESSLQAKKDWCRITERHAGIFTILLVAPGMDGSVALPQFG